MLDLKEFTNCMSFSAVGRDKISVTNGREERMCQATTVLESIGVNILPMIYSMC